jgi:23S rRNA pseudouridine2605 synthase
MMNSVKIAKYLSQAGIASRRKAETLVKQGLIFINGKKTTNVAARIDPETDKVEYNGKTVAPLGFVYYLLNKPVGYVSTTNDEHAEKMVTELVPKELKVWPVGRLDKFTSGLMILTNDGELTLKLTHPRYEIEKEYEIVTNFALTETDICAIQRGVKLEDGFIKPDHFEKIGPKSYRIVIHSGKKRVVRRIIEKTGKAVAELKRTRVGHLALGTLPPGHWRPLIPNELNPFSWPPTLDKKLKV